MTIYFCSFVRSKQKCIDYNYRIRNLPNDYVTTISGVQETELNAQTKHCLANLEKEVKVNNNL